MKGPLTEILEDFRRRSRWQGKVRFVMRRDMFVEDVALDAAEHGYEVGFDSAAPFGEVLILPIEP